MVRKVVTALAVALSAISATATAIDKRIVGGEEAKDLSQYPYLVSVHPMGGSYHFCGGILLDSTTVLTAAHCLYRPVKCREKPEDCQGDVFLVRAASLVNTLPFQSSAYPLSHQGALNRWQMTKC